MQQLHSVTAYKQSIHIDAWPLVIDKILVFISLFSWSKKVCLPLKTQENNWRIGCPAEQGHKVKAESPDSLFVSFSQPARVLCLWTTVHIPAFTAIIQENENEVSHSQKHQLGDDNWKKLQRLFHATTSQSHSGLHWVLFSVQLEIFQTKSNVRLGIREIQCAFHYLCFIIIIFIGMSLSLNFLQSVSPG